MANNKNDEEKIEIFLSHAEVDCDLATALQVCVAYALRIHKDQIFRTSDAATIGFGKISVDEITKAHKQAKVILSLMTPNSIFRPWPLLEAGGAHFHPRKAFFVTVANGITVNSLPDALHKWHIGSLARREVVEHLCKSLAKGLQLEQEFRSPKKRHIDNVVNLAKEFPGSWNLVTPALVAAKLVDSPFMVLNLLNEQNPNAAKKEVYLTAPNLRGLTRSVSTFGGAKKIKDQIFRWLSVDRERRFHVMITKSGLPEDEPSTGIKVWSETLGDSFLDDLKASTKEFEKWEAAAKAARPQLGFRLQFADFVQFSATFIDPTDSNDKGLALLRPFYWGAPPDMLPEIIISRERNRDAFDYYWLAFHRIYGGDKKRKVHSHAKAQTNAPA